LYDYLKSNDQFIVINENDPIQVEKTEGYDLIIPFGRRDSEFYFEKL
jgi:UDP-N-acetylmuramoyl-tripeptide--D-alanyl-D-alanine ligase